MTLKKLTQTTIADAFIYQHETTSEFDEFNQLIGVSKILKTSTKTN
jgi:hypothetical protein